MKIPLYFKSICALSLSLMIINCSRSDENSEVINNDPIIEEQYDIYTVGKDYLDNKTKIWKNDKIEYLLPGANTEAYDFFYDTDNKNFYTAGIEVDPTISPYAMGCLWETSVTKKISSNTINTYFTNILRIAGKRYMNVLRQNQSTVYASLFRNDETVYTMVDSNV